MTQKKIIVTIAADGASKVETVGFNGASCAAASKDIELALAGDFAGQIDDRKKPDFYATTSQGNQQTL